MAYTPQTVKDLRVYLSNKTGRDLAYFSVARSSNKSQSYHLGLDQIKAAGRTAANDYTIRTDRDKAGASDARSAIDINLGSVKEKALFKYLLDRCRSNAPGTSDIREIMGSLDGQVVLRWDRERGYSSAPQKGEADNSHLWHIHVSYYRDSERRDKIGVFKGFFGDSAPAPAPTPEVSDKMPILQNVKDNERGTLDVGTSILHPTTLQELFKLTTVSNASKIVGASPDGKYLGVLATTTKLTGTNPKLALVLASQVRNRRIEDPSAQLQEKMVLIRKDAESIVSRTQ